MKKNGILGNEGGYVKFIIITILLVCAVYAGIGFGMPYYRYSTLKNEAKELARISIVDLERTKAQLKEKAEDLNIPLKEDNLSVIREGKKVRVTASWSEKVDLAGLYEKTLQFNIDVEE